jgi:hypothetical protein
MLVFSVVSCTDMSARVIVHYNEKWLLHSEDTISMRPGNNGDKLTHFAVTEHENTMRLPTDQKLAPGRTYAFVPMRVLYNKQNVLGDGELTDVSPRPNATSRRNNAAGPKWTAVNQKAPNRYYTTAMADLAAPSPSNNRSSPRRARSSARFLSALKWPATRTLA